MLDAIRDRWIDAPDPPFVVTALATSIEGGILAVGVPYSGQPAVLTATYNFQVRRWLPGPALNAPRQQEVVTGLGGGRVLISGGNQGRSAVAAAAVFDSTISAPPIAAPGASVPNLPWPLLIAAAAVAGLALLSARRPRLWSATRPLFSALFQVAGLFALTWALVNVAGLEPPPVSTPTVAGAIRPAESALLRLPLDQLLESTATLSLTLAGLAVAWATAAGMGGAVFVVSLRQRRWETATAAAALLWVAPTFLLAILVQELQALIYGHSGLVVAAGFGDVSFQQVFWASVVLGLRPAAYLYRHTRDRLEVELTEDYARTAMAKGLSWREAISRHVVRASAAALLAPWLNAFRLMIGALPLVEFFFGYPGLGRVLILTLGLTYNGTAGTLREDAVVGIVVTMGLVLISAEALVAMLRRLLDPRLRELRLA